MTLCLKFGWNFCVNFTFVKLVNILIWFKIYSLDGSNIRNICDVFCYICDSYNKLYIFILCKILVVDLPYIWIFELLAQGEVPVGFINVYVCYSYQFEFSQICRRYLKIFAIYLKKIWMLMLIPITVPATMNITNTSLMKM